MSLKVKVNVKGAILLMVTTLQSFSGNAQTPELKTRVDTTTILIGEHITVGFEVKHSTNVEVYWPGFTETFGKFELVDAGMLLTSKAGGEITEKRDIVVTSFDSGYHVLEPFVFTYRLPQADTVIELTTEPFMIRVSTVEVDTSKAIRPIAGPYSEKRTFMEILPYIVIPVMIVVLALLLWLLWRSRQKKVEVLETIIPPDTSPFEWALQKLDDLARKKLWQQELIKQHYVELTDILRIYMEMQLTVPAVERTSDEIVNALSQKVDRSTLMKLESLLQTADMVKFAKAKPLPDEHMRAMEVAVDFVRATGEREQEPQAP